MNELINDLYNKIDNQDKIINEQVLEISRLKEQVSKAREYLKTWVTEEYSIYVIDEEDEDCCINEPNAVEILLEILGDKENESS